MEWNSLQRRRGRDRTAASRSLARLLDVLLPAVAGIRPDETRYASNEPLRPPTSTRHLPPPALVTRPQWRNYDGAEGGGGGSYPRAQQATGRKTISPKFFVTNEHKKPIG